MTKASTDEIWLIPARNWATQCYIDHHRLFPRVFRRNLVKTRTQAPLNLIGHRHPSTNFSIRAVFRILVNVVYMVEDWNICSPKYPDRIIICIITSSFSKTMRGRLKSRSPSHPRASEYCRSRNCVLIPKARHIISLIAGNLLTQWITGVWIPLLDYKDMRKMGLNAPVNGLETQEHSNRCWWWLRHIPTRPSWWIISNGERNMLNDTECRRMGLILGIACEILIHPPLCPWLDHSNFQHVMTTIIRQAWYPDNTFPADEPQAIASIVCYLR